MTEAELRPARLGWSALCFVLFAVLALLVSTEWRPLIELDSELGSWPKSFTSDHHDVYLFWHYLSIATDTWPKVVATAVAAVALWTKGYHRAAIWTVGVMASVGLLTTAIKHLIGRDRPSWLDPVEVLSTYSFPSGHSSGIVAAMGVAVVLTRLLIRRRGIRRLVFGVAVVMVLLVGADRVFLGLHNVSDVVAGYLLAATLLMLWLALFDPAPRSIAQTSEPMTEAVPNQRKKLAVILNPSKIDDAGQFRMLVETLADDSGFTSVVWWETTVEDTGYRMAHEAAVSGCDVVLAIGGDGTIRAVCEELAGTGIPVGIVPAGTGNLLARNLNIPLYLRSAVDVGLNGQDRAIDMVAVTGDKMDDTNFLVMAGMGFDAAIMEGVNEGIKAKVGWLAYVWSALKALMFPAIRVEVSVDGGEFTRHRARTIVIGNVGFLQAGMPLLPDAAIDDGLLDVVILHPRNFFAWIPLAWRVLLKRKHTDELVNRMIGQTVVVRAAADTPRQLDGDSIGPGRELAMECVHGRLLVRVPR